MKVKKQIIAFYLVIAMLTIVVSNLFSVKVYADVPSTQKVVKHSDTFTTLPFFWNDSDYYFTIEDSTGLSESSLANPTMYYTTDGVKFDKYDEKKIFTTTLNNKAGVIVQALDSIFSAWTTLVGVLNQNNYRRMGLYNSNGVFLGVVLNDIEGCYYAENSSDGINIPDDYSDGVKSFWDYYNEQNNTIDWFTYYPDNQLVTDNLNTVESQTRQTNFINLINSHQYVFPNQYYTSSDTFKWKTYNNVQYTDDIFLVASTETYFNDFISKFLIEGENELTLQHLIDVFENYSGSKYLNFKIFNQSNEQITTINCANLDDNTITQVNVFGDPNLGNNYGGQHYCIFGNQPITIYKSLSVATGIQNQTYYPSYYTTDSYNNYNINEDNSITTNKRTVNNSITYNDNIYDDANGDYYNYVNNSTVNTENITTNVTNITNNYYDSTEPDNPDNDNPNNPDEPDTPILDRLLKAILDFFEAIGKVIATVLTGLIEMFASVLDAIAEITGQIVNLTDFFESILGWLPEPIPAVLGLGISICILAAVIKFIRG